MPGTMSTTSAQPSPDMEASPAPATLTMWGGVALEGVSSITNHDLQSFDTMLARLLGKGCGCSILRIHSSVKPNTGGQRRRLLAARTGQSTAIIYAVTWTSANEATLSKAMLDLVGSGSLLAALKTMPAFAAVQAVTQFWSPSLSGPDSTDLFVTALDTPDRPLSAFAVAWIIGASAIGGILVVTLAVVVVRHRISRNRKNVQGSVPDQVSSSQRIPDPRSIDGSFDDVQTVSHSVNLAVNVANIPNETHSDPNSITSSRPCGYVPTNQLTAVHVN